jgi:hypothetical protein
MAYGLWDVEGSFIIPGTRTKGSLARMRIGDKDRQTASKHIAKLLNEKFRRDLRGDNKFSDHFALMNLRWTPFAHKAVVQVQSADKAAE